MDRPIYNQAIRTAAITRANFHANILKEVESALEEHSVVVVGMALNPFVSKIRKSLDKLNIEYFYLEYGGYFSMWKERLAIKMWSGWPTFPQVFVQGKLIGGHTDFQAAVNSGELKDLLERKDDE